MIDWQAIGDEAAGLLSSYLQIDTTNPPGNESAAADFFATELKRRGMAATIYPAGEKRANLVARLPGNGKKKPLLLSHHSDVVEADPQRWSCDPLGGLVKDGYVWGRGAIDMKGMGIMQLLALDLLRRSKRDRTRDVIFLMVADEEKGGEFGTKAMIERHWQEIEAEYVWDEGGFGLRDMFGPNPVFTVAVAEKKDLWVKVIAHGKPGHSGMPSEDNAAVVLMRALERILSLNEQITLSPVVQRMFREISQNLPFPKSFLLKHLDNPLFLHLAQPALTASPTVAAMMRDTLSVTVLRAGSKENMIPERAEATLDIRLLPEHDTDGFLKTLNHMVGDARVEFEILHAPQPAVVSAMDSEFFTALKSVLGDLVPGSRAVPMLTPGTTDSCFYRQRGVNCYGLFPALIDADELARFHGIDERISIENLILGTRIVYEVLDRLTE